MRRFNSGPGVSPEHREWYVLAYGRDEHNWAHNQQKRTPKELLFDDKRTWDAWGKIARVDPVLSFAASNMAIKPAPILSTHLNQRSQLLNISTEIQFMILSQLDEGAYNQSKVDILALALTCTHLLSLSISYIVEDRVKDWSDGRWRWTGAKIACVPDTVQDFPELLKDEDIQGSQLSSPKRIIGRRYRSMCVPWPDQLFHPRRVTLENCPREWKATKIWADIERHASQIDILFPKDADFVLRNLKTKEFVCCQPGTEGKAHVRHADKNRYWLRVEDVLLMHICWVGIPECIVGPRCEGIWAGHRFDIVSAWMHEAETKDGDGGDWEDVTQRVFTCARKVKAEVGKRCSSWNLMRYPLTGR